VIENVGWKQSSPEYKNNDCSGSKNGRVFLSEELTSSQDRLNPWNKLQSIRLLLNCDSSEDPFDSDSVTYNRSVIIKYTAENQYVYFLKDVINGYTRIDISRFVHRFKK
jgi:hypothetical protein